MELEFTKHEENEIDRCRATAEKNKTRKSNFIFLEEINNYRKNIVIDPKFSNFFDPKWYQFYINDPECIVCSSYFVQNKG